MFFDVNVSTKAGLAHNEDAVFANQSLLIVMDGASSLGGFHLTPAPTDACWLAGETVAMLAEKLALPSVSIPEALTQTAAELRAKLLAFGYPEDPYTFPSGSVMLARDLGDQVELFSLGDCTALVCYADGRPALCFHDDAVTRLDAAVLAQAGKLAREAGMDVADVLPRLHPMLVENRLKRNRENGYWIFEPAGLGVPHGQRLLLPKENMHSLALMSDGFYDMVEMDGGPSHQQMLNLLETTPADALIERLYAALEKDPRLNAFPRFKIKDDATVAFARLR